MDHIQTRYFFDCMDQYFKTKIYSTFIERAGNIENKNGKIKANNIYSSVSKSNMDPKKHSLIKSIFEELQDRQCLIDFIFILFMFNTV